MPTSETPKPRTGRLPLLLLPGLASVCLAVVAVHAGEPARHPQRARRGEPRRQRHDAQQHRYARSVLPLLAGHRPRGRSQVQGRQRHLPQAVDLRAVVDDELRRSRPAVQFALLPELPSEGWARPSAGGEFPCRYGRIDVPAPFHSPAERRAKAPARRASRQLDQRADLRRAVAEYRRAGPRQRRPYAHRLHRSSR